MCAENWCATSRDPCFTNLVALNSQIIFRKRFIKRNACGKLVHGFLGPVLGQLESLIFMIFGTLGKLKPRTSMGAPPAFTLTRDIVLHDGLALAHVEDALFDGEGAVHRALAHGHLSRGLDTEILVPTCEGSRTLRS